MIKKVLFIINIIFVAGIAPVFSAAVTVQMSRENVMANSFDFVRGLSNSVSYQEAWNPQTLQTGNGTGTVIFKTYFTGNGYLQQTGNNKGNPSGLYRYEGNNTNYIIGEEEGNSSTYWVVPYCLGGYDTEQIAQDRIQNSEAVPVPGTDVTGDRVIMGPICPGGYTTRRALTNGTINNLRRLPC